MLDADNAILMGFVVGHFINRDNIALMAVVGIDHALQARGFAVMQHIGQQQGKRLVADNLARAPDSVAETKGGLLAGKTGLACPRQVDFQQFQFFDLVAVTQGAVQLVLDIEMILDRALVAACHEDEMLDSGGARLIDDMLDHRTIDDRQHLFGDGLGGGQKTGAQSGHRKNRLANSCLTCALAHDSRILDFE